MTHALSFLAGFICGGLVCAASLIIWALRGYQWLARGK